MAEQTTDRLGDDDGLGPDGGTAGASPTPEAQGAQTPETGGAPPAPAVEPAAGTGEPEPIDLSQPQEGGPAGGRGTDVQESFKEFSQQAYQQQVERGKELRADPRYAALFDERGRLKAPEEVAAGVTPPSTGAQEAGIDLSGGTPPPQVQAQAPEGAPQWQNPYEQVNAILDQAATQGGWIGFASTLEKLRQDPRYAPLLGVQRTTGGNATTPEQMQAVARQTYEQLQERSTTLLRGMRSLRAELSDEFMRHEVPGLNGVKMPLEDAVLELCSQNGVLDPRQVMVSDPRLQPHYIAQKMAIRDRQIAESRAPGGTQLPSTGASVPPAYAGSNANTLIEDAGFSTTPPARQ